MSEQNQSEGKILGELEPGEVQALNSLRQSEQELTFRIGQSFRELVAMTVQAGETNQRMQDIMLGVRKRLDIPEQKTLRISLDGKIQLVEPPESQ